MANVNPAFLQPANPELAKAAAETNERRRRDVIARIEASDVPIAEFKDVSAPSVFPEIEDCPPTRADVDRLRKLVDAAYANDATAAIKVPAIPVPEGGYKTWPPAPRTRAPVAPWTDAVDVRKWPAKVRATVHDLSNLDEVEGVTTRKKVQNACSDYRWAPFFAAWVLLLVVLCLLRYCAFK